MQMIGVSWLYPGPCLVLKAWCDLGNPGFPGKPGVAGCCRSFRSVIGVVVKRQQLLLPGLRGLYPEKCNGKTARKTVLLRSTQQMIDI